MVKDFLIFILNAPLVYVRRIKPPYFLGQYFNKALWRIHLNFCSERTILHPNTAIHLSGFMNIS